MSTAPQIWYSTFVGEGSIQTPPHILTMNNTIGFPPADALLVQLTKVDYQKLFAQFVILSATALGIIVGAVQFVYNKTAQWYQSGGKEQLLAYAHQTAQFINNKTQLFDKLYAATVSVYNRIELLAHKIEDLVAA
jgi:H+/Cl- antiporter ClcA